MTLQDELESLTTEQVSKLWDKLIGTNSKSATKEAQIAELLLIADHKDIKEALE